MNYVVKLVLLMTLCLCSACSIAAHSNANRTIGPYCLAEFCFDVDSIDALLNEDYVVAKYGSNNSPVTKFTSYCYYDKSEKIYIKLTPYHGEGREIIEVFASIHEVCKGSRIPLNSFSSVKTTEGLKIGDPAEKVIRLYGQPQKEKMIHHEGGPERVLRYAPSRKDLLFTEVFIENEQVSGLLLSLSP